MTLYIAPVVEGQTEQGCVERLLHRVWGELLVRPDRLQVLKPFRGSRDEFVRPDGRVLADSVEKAGLSLAARTKTDPAARSLVLVLLDADEDCPAALAPVLLRAAQSSVPAGVAVACVLARRMIENWIVAGCATLAGVNGLPAPLHPPPDPEDRSGAKWLSDQMRGVNPTRPYKKTADAAAFVGGMNLRQCRDTAPSFDKLCRDLESLFPPLPPTTPPAAEPLPST